VSNANEGTLGTSGGRGGIRTLEAVLPPTRFPVARTRPGYATLPWRRGWDSNPRWLITTPLFESGTFNHSDTSPTCEVYQRGLATGGQIDVRTAKPPGGYRAACQRYAWQDSNLRPLGPQPNALSPELQARIAYFTPDRLRPAVAGHPGREGRDSNPRSAFSALNRLAGGPIRPLWHLPRWLCPRLASGVACTGFQAEKSTTGADPEPRFRRLSGRGTTPG
jgi:hypothetical protein